jgi:hypothetical protein
MVVTMHGDRDTVDGEPHVSTAAIIYTAQTPTAAGATGSVTSVVRRKFAS